MYPSHLDRNHKSTEWLDIEIRRSRKQYVSEMHENQLFLLISLDLQMSMRAMASRPLLVVSYFGSTVLCFCRDGAASLVWCEERMSGRQSTIASCTYMVEYTWTNDLGVNVFMNRYRETLSKAKSVELCSDVAPITLLTCARSIAKNPKVLVSSIIVVARDIVKG